MPRYCWRRRNLSFQLQQTYVWSFRLWPFQDENARSISVRREWGCSLPRLLPLDTFHLCCPNASPSCSQKRFLPVHASLCMLALVLYYLTFQGTVLHWKKKKVLYCNIKNVFFTFCICFLCIICMKSVINLLQYNTI